jgi:EmrB/QacA subfamily drug resistance transporter
MTSASVATAGRRARTGGVLFSMCLSLVLVVASVSALNLALPELAVDLGASNTDLTWIADGYTVALAALVLPLGALGDRIGRRNVLVAGTVVFGAASLAAALTSGVGTLILLRIVMGVGAAAIMPGTLSTITAAFPPEQRAKGVATWAGFAAAGAIIGMLTAGALLERWGWASIFVVSTGVAVAAGLSAVLLAPNTRERGHGPFDVLGSLALTVGIGGLVYAIIEGADRGWTEPTTLVGIALAVIGGVGYVLADLRHPAPLLDPRLFVLRGFQTGALTIVVQFMAVFGFFFVGLQYLQLLLGYSPLKAAVALVPVAMVVLPASQLTPGLVRRAGVRNVMTFGLLCLAGSVFWLATLDVHSGYAPFLVGLLVAGVGIGLTGSVSTSSIVGSLSTDKQGVASAMNDAAREVGSAVGIALMGSVYGSHYRDALPEPPAILPADVVEAIRDSAAAGIAVAEQAGAIGEPLAVAVRQAFIEGLSASLVVIGVVLAAAAVVACRRAPKHAEAPGDVADPASTTSAALESVLHP